VIRQFGADRLEEGQLWRELGKTLAQLGLTAPHFVVAWCTARIYFGELCDQCAQYRSRITDKRDLRLADPRGLVRVGVDAHDLQRLVHTPLCHRIEKARADCEHGIRLRPSVAAKRGRT